MHMNILILGASLKTSIGYTVGELLQTEGHTITYASRSGKLGVQCDITDPRSIKKVVATSKADAVIIAAGIFLNSGHVGKLKETDRVRQHLLAKSFGALVVADALVAARPDAQLIVFGGRDVSGDPGFAPYTIGNGALINLIKFLDRHKSVDAYYLDLSFVEDSTMEKAFAARTGKSTKHGNIAVADVAAAIRKILLRKERRRRIVLGKGTV